VDSEYFDLNCRTYTTRINVLEHSVHRCQKILGKEVKVVKRSLIGCAFCKVALCAEGQC
jgi:hypothetical protein